MEKQRRRRVTKAKEARGFAKGLVFMWGIRVGEFVRQGGATEVIGFQRPLDLKSVFMMLERVASKRSCAVSLPKGVGSLKKVSEAQFRRISASSQARAYRHQRLAEARETPRALAVSSRDRPTK